MVVATRLAFAERVGEFCNSENGKWYPDLDCVVCEECCALERVFGIAEMSLIPWTWGQHLMGGILSNWL